MNISRGFPVRWFLCAVGLGLAVGVNAGAPDADPPDEGFANPIGVQADPWIIQDQDHYLACFSEGDRGISVRVSERLTRLGPPHLVWTPPPTGPCSREIWAPELHRLDGRWYIYFAASDGQNQDHRAWVLQSKNTDPLGPYTLHGPLYTGDDPALQMSNCWAIDLTVLELGSRRYAIWSGWQDGRDVQYLYIAPLQDPLTIAAPRTRVCPNDEFVWERVGDQPSGRGLNEGPEVLQHGGRTFLVFSCSGSWQPTYKLGMLELRAGGDPLHPADWRKFPAPVFQSSERTFGVGHNSFVKSPDGTEDWLVYHAKWDRPDGWSRVVYAQPFKWDADGLPVFGQPVAPGEVLPLPSGERLPQVSGAYRIQFRALSGLEGWSYYGGPQWMTMRHDGLQLGGGQPGRNRVFPSGGKLVLDGGAWTNFEATLALRPAAGRGQLGLLFRVRDPAVGDNAQRGYFAGYAPGESRLVLGFTDGTVWREIASSPAAASAAADLVLSVVASGSHLQVGLQGEQLLDATDATYASGSVGLRVVDAAGVFSKLELKPLDGPSVAVRKP